MKRGFTLLEVLVAVAILGLGLTAILSAQYGSLKAVSHAKGMSVAVGLARCKMTEIEQHLQKDGFQLTEEADSGSCCDKATPGYWCEWRIDKPVFPEGAGKLDLDTSGLDPSKLGGVGKMASNAGPGGVPQNLDLDAGIGGITQALGPGMDQMLSGGMGGITSMVMGLVYPAIKKLFEASSRRITLTIHWDERGRDYSFGVVQWVTKPQPPMGPDNQPEDLNALLGAASSGAGTPAAGTPAGSPGTVR